MDHLYPSDALFMLLFVRVPSLVARYKLSRVGYRRRNWVIS